MTSRSDWKLGQAAFQFSEGDVDGTRKMALRKFIRRPHIKHRHRFALHPREQFLSRDWFKCIPSVKEVSQQLTDLGEIAFADAPERLHQPHNFYIAGEAIEDMLTGAPVSELGMRAEEFADAEMCWRKSA